MKKNYDAATKAADEKTFPNETARLIAIAVMIIREMSAIEILIALTIESTDLRRRKKTTDVRLRTLREPRTKRKNVLVLREKPTRNFRSRLAVLSPHRNHLRSTDLPDHILRTRAERHLSVQRSHLQRGRGLREPLPDHLPRNLNPRPTMMRKKAQKLPSWMKRRKALR